MANDNNEDAYASSSSSSSSSSSTSLQPRPKGPLGIDPLHFSVGLFIILVLYVFYLMLPRAVRKQYFGAYAKRHAWSARSRNSGSGNSVGGAAMSSRSYGQVREIFVLLEGRVMQPCRF